MENLNIGVAIGTAYGADPVARVRFGLAQELVRKALETGYQVYFADNSPDDSTITTLVGLGAVGGRISNPALPCLGRAESIRLALEAGNDYIVITEAEKIPLIDELAALAAHAEKHALDIVFPTRSAKAMLTHPTNMQVSEPVGNAEIAKVTGFDYDWFMGAHLLSRKAAARYVELQSASDAFWVGGQMAAAATCMREGMTSGAYELQEYYYPKAQRESEEGNPVMDEKRQRILKEIVERTNAAWLNQ